MARARREEEERNAAAARVRRIEEEQAAAAALQLAEEERNAAAARARREEEERAAVGVWLFFLIMGLPRCFSILVIISVAGSRINQDFQFLVSVLLLIHAGIYQCTHRTLNCYDFVILQ